MIFRFAFFVLLVVRDSESSCNSADRCCAGRDSSCRVFGFNGTACYCDEGCLETGDCCSDYFDYCDMRVTDCETSRWSEWSECSASCGKGVKRRSRVVVEHPSPGGKSCGALSQSRRCVGQRCSLEYKKYKSPLRETAGLLSAKFLSKKASSSWDIRQNLFVHNEWEQEDRVEDGYQSDQPPAHADYCIVFELVKSSKACQKDEDFYKMHKGTTMCALCTKSSRRKSLGDRCRGHGVPSKLTRWRSTFKSNCHGKWKRTHELRHCGRICPNGPDFIFV